MHPRRILTIALFVTALVSTVFGVLAVADLLFRTTYWPDNVEYGPQLLFVGWILYYVRPEGDGVEKWEWIGVPCLVAAIWLLVAAATPTPRAS